MSDLRTAMIQYATRKKGAKVGTGQCWDLAHLALTESGAKSAADFGTGTKTSDDKWGTPVPLASAQPGDVLQFRDHRATVERSRLTRVTFPDRSWIEYEETESQTFTRGHHTAIAASAVRNGTITVLEQHVQRGRGVVEETAGEGTVYVESRSAPPRRFTENVLITAAWAQKVKKVMPADAKLIDQLAKAHAGKSVPATVETRETVTVSGTIWAYTPVARAGAASPAPGANRPARSGAR